MHPRKRKGILVGVGGLKEYIYTVQPEAWNSYSDDHITGGPKELLHVGLYKGNCYDFDPELNISDASGSVDSDHLLHASTYLFHSCLI